MKKIICIAAIVVIAVAALAVFNCGPQKPRLYIYNWTYYIPDEVLEDFQKRYGIKVIYDMYASNEEMYAKLKVGGGSRYDLVFPSGDFTSIMRNEGMLQEIDKSRIPNFSNIDPEILPRLTFDPGSRFSVPYAMGMAGISVNTARVPEFEKSWRIFENPALRGRFTLLDDMREVLGAALRTLGYSLNSKNPAELEEAKAVVLEWKKGAVKFDAEAFGKGFAAGEFWAVHGYAENVFLEIDDNMRANTVFFVPKEGGPVYMDNMVILKDARNIDAAYKFINYIHEPEVYAKIMDYFELPSVNIPARAHMTVTPHYQIEDMADSEFKEDLGEHLEMYNRIWQEIRIGR
ncbi:MAG: extracellular solute-binding protein [Chitinispirillales bacterium]|jgi:spermidine/putrescine transport system substrate-binding protein|nr:extracellular solute-binding protein [Chitinispirillales bacterium]